MKLKVENLMKMSYLEWVREVNKNFDPDAPEKSEEGGINLSLRNILMPSIVYVNLYHNLFFQQIIGYYHLFFL